MCVYIYIYIYILALTPCIKCTDVSMILIDCGSDQQCLNHKIDQQSGKLDPGERRIQAQKGLKLQEFDKELPYKSRIQAQKG